MIVRYKEFSILEIARKCGVPVLRRLPDGQWLARCPFCGDSRKSESHGHLYLNEETGEYHCKRCWEGGYAVGFYARLRGVDTRTAYKELCNASESIFAEIRKKQAENPPAPEVLAPPEHRHRVYSRLLELLDLHPAHRVDLLRRGFPEAVIERNGYRSIPSPKRRAEVCKALARDFDLAGTPGFYTIEGRWDMAAPVGYLIPVRGINQQIRGFQVRLDRPSPDGGKYVWFSSRGKESGTGARGWIHVARPLHPTSVQRVWVTEGALKADIAAHYLGVVVLGVPGAKAWRAVAEAVRALGSRQVVLAYDADQIENPVVAQAADDLRADLEKRKISVFPARWPPEIGKGIDDACVTLTRQRQEVSEAVFVDGVKITRTVTVTESLQVSGRPENAGVLGRIFGRFLGYR